MEALTHPASGRSGLYQSRKRQIAGCGEVKQASDATRLNPPHSSDFRASQQISESFPRQSTNAGASRQLMQPGHLVPRSFRRANACGRRNTHDDRGASHETHSPMECLFCLLPLGLHPAGPRCARGLRRRLCVHPGCFGRVGRIPGPARNSCTSSKDCRRPALSGDTRRRDSGVIRGAPRSVLCSRHRAGVAWPVRHRSAPAAASGGSARRPASVRQAQYFRLFRQQARNNLHYAGSERARPSLLARPTASFRAATSTGASSCTRSCMV